MADKKFDLSVIMRLIDKASKPLKEIGREFEKLGKDTAKTTTKFEKLSKTLNRVGTKMKSIGQNLSLKVSLPLGILAGLATRSAIKFESAFTGVRKTVDATEGQFKTLKKELMDLALELPVATDELFGIAEAAGQLDIKLPFIPGFVKTMAALGIAAPVLDMQQAAIQLAKFANITQMSQGNFDKLASTLVFLGNNSATTEDSILNMSMRLAAAGKQIGASESEIFGLATALAELGLEPQMGGTAISRVMRKMKKEIALNSDLVQGFAVVSDQSAKDFKKSWEEDSLGAVVKFIEGLGTLKKRGLPDIEVVLDALKFDATRVADALGRASGSGDRFRETIKKGSDEWKRNTALLEELGKRLEDTAAQLKIAKNRAEQTAVSFGDILKVGLLEAVEALKPLMDWFRALDTDIKKAIIGVGIFVFVLGPLATAIGIVLAAFGGAAVAGALLTIGAVTLAFVGIGAAIFQIIRYWDDLELIWKDWSEWIVDLTEKYVKLEEVINRIKDFNAFVQNPIKYVMDQNERDKRLNETNKEIKQKKSRPGRFQQYAGDGADPLKTKEEIKKERENERDKRLNERSKRLEEIKDIGFIADKFKSLKRLKSRPGRFQQYAGDGISPLESKNKNIFKVGGNIPKNTSELSKTEVTIEVKADPGTSAIVEKIKSKGKSIFNLITDGFVGKTQ